jgi:hypothetical protein
MVLSDPLGLPEPPVYLDCRDLRDLQDLRDIQVPLGRQDPLVYNRQSQVYLKVKSKQTQGLVLVQVI